MADPKTEEAKKLFASRLKAKLAERHMNQNTLAELLGMSESSIGKWTLGKSMPRTMGQIEKISSIFGVEKSYFLEPDPPTVQPSTTEHPAANSYVHIPVLGTIPAGIPSEAIESVLDYEDIPADMAKHGNFYGLIARGHSMEPTINDGDVVIIRQQPTVESGEIAVVKLNGNEATLKEVKITDEGIFIIGHNRSAFEPMFLTHEQAKSLPLRILGKAVELRRTLGK